MFWGWNLPCHKTAARAFQHGFLSGKKNQGSEDNGKTDQEHGRGNSESEKKQQVKRIVSPGQSLFEVPAAARAEGIALLYVLFFPLFRLFSHGGLEFTKIDNGSQQLIRLTVR